MWVKRLLFGQRFAVFVVGLALLAGLLTFVAFTQWSPITDNPDWIIGVLLADLAVVLLLTGVIAIRLLPLLRSRSGMAGSKLHRRLALFSALLAAAPTLFFTAFGGVYFYMGIQAWFNEKVQVAIQGSETVAQAYLEEHKKNIQADALAMASDLVRYISNDTMDEGFEDYFRSQTYLRNLSEAVLTDDRGRTVIQSGLSYSLAFDTVPESALDDANAGETILFLSDTEDRIRALVRLNTIEPLYLYVGRMVDEAVLARVQETRDAAQEYNQLRKQAKRVQKYSLLMFASTGLLLVLAAVWFGLSLARRLMTPLSAIMNTAERVGAGDYSARVSNFEGFDEFRSMAKTFNTMTAKIQDNIAYIEMTQKQLAWGEVARRVAHEIKNPLTPIQLAADRLRRKYSSQITTDKDIFDESISTIIKHVDDLKNMVNDFAQMGAAQSMPKRIDREDITALCLETFNLQREAFPEIVFHTFGTDAPVVIMTDAGRLRQALLNLVTNARNALSENNIENPLIGLAIEPSDTDVRISIMDNGPGFPEDTIERQKLLQPYVTTRRKGTGLGLAIVNKAAEDLGGTFSLQNGTETQRHHPPFRGAHAVLTLPKVPAAT